MNIIRFRSVTDINRYRVNNWDYVQAITKKIDFDIFFE